MIGAIVGTVWSLTEKLINEWFSFGDNAALKMCDFLDTPAQFIHCSRTPNWSEPIARFMPVMEYATLFVPGANVI